MAIIASDTSVLDALNEEIIYGPGGVSLYTDDTDLMYLHFTATSGTWTISFSWSVDGTNYYSASVFPIVGFGVNSSISASGTTFNTIYRWTTSNTPYLKVKMTAYTSGVVTVRAAAYRQQTR